MATPFPGNSETQEMSRPRETFIGPYRIEVKIGDGGMGVVYKCQDAKLKRSVALKVLKEKYAVEPLSRERFRREAQAIASLSHPNVVQLYAIEEEHGRPPYLVMEYIDGPSAESLLRSPQSLTPERATAVIRDAACGLRAALEKGIIHRDVKPSNILIASNGAGKIVDFGLAKEIEGAPSLTEEGMVVGTPHYISPEQGRGQKVDQRSDIYSLGATLYHLLAGRPPFEGESQLAVIVAHLNAVPEPPHKVRKEVPEALSLVVGKMMAKDPSHRYASYDALLADLELVAQGKALGRATMAEGAATFRAPRGRVPARFWGLAAGAVAAAVALTVAVATHLLPLESQEASQLRRLKAWHLRQEPTRECFDLVFAAPPEGLSRPELVHTLFAAGLEDQEQVTIDLPGPSLRLKDLSGPVAFRFPFQRLDEVSLRGVRIDGRADVGLALIHPDGGRLRSIVFALRSGTGRDAPGAEELKAPIRARRSGDDVACSPAPSPARPLGPGPHDIDVRFQREGDATRIRFEVWRPGGPEPVYAAGGKNGVLLPGTDWNGGVLLLWAPSPLHRATAVFNGMRLVGQAGGAAIDVLPADVQG